LTQLFGSKPFRPHPPDRPERKFLRPLSEIKEMGCFGLSCHPFSSPFHYLPLSANGRS
jgi:hypothetical protein